MLIWLLEWDCNEKNLNNGIFDIMIEKCDFGCKIDEIEKLVVLVGYEYV